MAANAARAVAAGLPARPGAEPPALYSFDPGDGPPRRDHAPLQHRDHRRHQRRLSVRRDRPRAALRRPPGDRRHARRARPCRPSASSRATATAGSGSPRRARPAAAPSRPLRLLRAPRGVGSPGSTLRPFAGPVRRPARDRRGARRRRRRALDLHVPPQLDHRRVDRARDHRAGAAAPRRCSRARAASEAAVWALLRDGQAVQVTERAAGEGRRRVLGPERALGLRRRADRPRQGRDRLDRPAATASRPRPDPGPTLSVELTRRLARKRAVQLLGPDRARRGSRCEARPRR